MVIPPAYEPTRRRGSGVSPKSLMTFVTVAASGCLKTPPGRGTRLTRSEVEGPEDREDRDQRRHRPLAVATAVIELHLVGAVGRMGARIELAAHGQHPARPLGDAVPMGQAQLAMEQEVPVD